jgi:hypothetical protein
MLDRTFFRRVRLLRGREEIITFRYTINKDDQLVEHGTMAVPVGFLKAGVPVTVPSNPGKV